MTLLLNLLKRTLKAPVSSSVLGSLIRHGLSALGALLLSLQLDPAVVDQFLLSAEPVVVGLVALLASLALSYLNKREKSD